MYALLALYHPKPNPTPYQKKEKHKVFKKSVYMVKRQSQKRK